MQASEIKRLRTESILKELIPQALSTLEDNMLNSLCVVDVECKRGRYDAFIYLDKMMFDEVEQNYILSHLKKVSKYISNFCASEQGWYKAPNLHFKFDDRLEYQNRMDDLFKKIEKDLND